MRRILLTILVLCALVSYALAQAPPPSPGCPPVKDDLSTNPPTLGYCTKANQGKMTAYCGYEQCKKGVTSEESGIEVRAASGEGFPMAWFVSTKGTMSTDKATYKCELVEQKDKTLVRIPATVTLADGTVVKNNRRCRLDLDIGDGQVYHEHFVSNPDKECLGWVECKEPAPVPAK